MNEAVRTMVYDWCFGIEAYRFQGLFRPFPTHFHDYYVIGCVEAGARDLLCGSGRYALETGAIVLFHPGEAHACVQRGEEPMTYLSLGLSKRVMENLVWKATGKRGRPAFSANVISDSAVGECFRDLHEQILTGSAEGSKEKTLFALGTLLLERYGGALDVCGPPLREEVELSCRYMESRYADRITLEEICAHVNLGKSTLLRAFVKSKGVSPYRYLENIRIEKAKELLDGGVPPSDAALRTGFFDQSHFTNCFTRCIGIPPGMYQKLRRN